MDFLAEGAGYRSDRKIVHKAALIKMIKVLSGEMDTEDVEKWMEEQQIREEAEVTVCELFDQYERKGRAEGIKEGEKKGKTVLQSWHKCLWMVEGTMTCGELFRTRITGNSYIWKLTAYPNHCQV